MNKGIVETILSDEINPPSKRKHIVLSSSCIGGARYMIQNHQDALAICKSIGYPDLFIIFTCNPKWPKIQRFIRTRKLKAKDRLDIVCRVFKIKLDHMIKDIRGSHIFDRVKVGNAYFIL